MKKRFFGLDLVRVCAIFLVILVHSFMHSGYNYANINGIYMFVLLTIRCLAHCGVLLFIILTGYLDSERKIDNKHYKSIIDILITYFIISIICLIFKKVVLRSPDTIIKSFADIFRFTAAPYAWYVKMYIGLFFLIPFLNILYKNIDTKKHKQLLIITLFIISSLFPTLNNIYIEDFQLNIFPGWWALSYPILMYFIGSYIREYKINISKGLNICILMFTVLFDAIILYFYLHNRNLNAMKSSEYYAFSVIISVMIFLLLYNIKTHSKSLVKVIGFFSKVSFGAYLISWIFDRVVYDNTTFLNTNPRYYLICSIILTPIIFIFSSASSYLVNLLICLSKKMINHIKEVYKNKTNGYISD